MNTAELRTATFNLLKSYRVSEHLDDVVVATGLNTIVNNEDVEKELINGLKIAKNIYKDEYTYVEFKLGEVAEHPSALAATHYTPCPINPIKCVNCEEMKCYKCQNNVQKVYVIVNVKLITEELIKSGAELSRRLIQAWAGSVLKHELTHAKQRINGEYHKGNYLQNPDELEAHYEGYEELKAGLGVN